MFLALFEFPLGVGVKKNNSKLVTTEEKNR